MQGPSRTPPRQGGDAYRLQLTAQSSEWSPAVALAGCGPRHWVVPCSRAAHHPLRPPSYDATLHRTTAQTAIAPPPGLRERQTPRDRRTVFSPGERYRSSETATRVPLGHATIVEIVAGFGDGGQPPRSDARPTSKVLVSMPIGALHGRTLAHTSRRHPALTGASPPCPPQDSWSDCVSSKTGRAGLGRASCWFIADIPPPHHRSAQPVRQGTCLSRDAGRESSCICFVYFSWAAGSSGLLSGTNRSSPTRAAPHEDGPRPGLRVMRCIAVVPQESRRLAGDARIPVSSTGGPGRTARPLQTCNGCVVYFSQNGPWHVPSFLPVVLARHIFSPSPSLRSSSTFSPVLPHHPIFVEAPYQVSNRCRPRPRPPHHYPYPRRRTFLSPSRIVRQSRGHPAHPAPSQRHFEIRSLRQTPSCTTQWPNAL
ncbi:hypothetical protein B0T11DRAFT_140496 [Plectosphaerella cucumerina]|uniref:Uncharacterized protein n=1 Tax=Plectosphaerella cucumerina TaxID=40658 RepID=A0A8K0T465_9PEZI|nr:hypothetical protein B0T11DRAFT_140496 [Plectosphaerella cucumerina]